MKTREALEQLARKHLPSDIAERWISLLRPAARLVVRTSDSPLVGQLGGVPELPRDMDWPTWEDEGPLSFIASVDCSRLSTFGLDIPLPRAGRLSFFYFDGSFDDSSSLVIYSDPSTHPASRVLFHPPGTELVRRELPQGLVPFRKIDLTAEPITTFPSHEHSEFESAFRRPGESWESFRQHPAMSDSFNDALYELDKGPRHQVGGHADPVQGPVEHEIASGVLGDHVSWNDPGLIEEAATWRLLCQIDTDDAANMMWGDVGTLYWLMKPAELRAARFDLARFTWQCS